MKERWRDIGNGKIKDEATGRVVPLLSVRRDPPKHEIELNAAEWAKLVELGESFKKKRTPQQCVSAMIASCQPGGSGWKCPGS